ncbi:MAG: ABC transporter substrate-binding protein [Promethearchaeota archaeon]
MRGKEKDKLLNSIIIIGIILNIAFFGYLIIINQPRTYPFPLPQPSGTLVIGYPNPPSTLDPLNSTDRNSNFVIEQLAETLFTYDFSNQSLPRIPKLVESYWWENTTTLHIKLRENIIFHDFTDFNANATKWNIDRLLYLTNCTETLPGTKYTAKSASLYFFPDGETPIINHVDSDGAYNVTIYLNGYYAPFLDILCHPSSSILSPSSTPEDNYISLIYGTIVGTGPFIFEHYVPNVEVRLARFDYNWGGAPWFSDVIIAFINNPTTRNNAMLGHEIDWLDGFIPELIPTFEADPTITAMKFTDSYGIPGLDYYYLGMNTIEIPIYWRKAISYTINYTYIIEDLMLDLAVRANSPISLGYGSAWNASNSAPDYDLQVARQIIVDNVPAASGFPVNADPIDATWLGSTLFIVNYTYDSGNSFRDDICNQLNSTLPAIGIQLIDDELPKSEFNRRIIGDHNKLGLFWLDWKSNQILEPFNMLNSLFNPISYLNSVQVNDSKLNTMMNLAFQTTDNTARNTLYKNIQWYLANRLYPHCFGFHPKIVFVHSANIRNVPYNFMGKLYVYPTYRD